MTLFQHWHKGSLSPHSTASAMWNYLREQLESTVCTEQEVEVTKKSFHYLNTKFIKGTLGNIHLELKNEKKITFFMALNYEE